MDTAIKQVRGVQSERYQAIGDLDPVGHVVYLGFHSRAVDVLSVDVELTELIV